MLKRMCPPNVCRRVLNIHINVHIRAIFDTYFGHRILFAICHILQKCNVDDTASRSTTSWMQHIVVPLHDRNAVIHSCAPVPAIPRLFLSLAQQQP